MKYTELLSIPIRVLGIYIFYSTFLAVIRQYFLLTQVAATNSGEYKTYAAIAIFEISFMLIAALALTKLPLTISKFLTPVNSESTLNTNITAEQLQSVALCILGIYIITKNISDLIFNAAWLISYIGQPPEYPGRIGELAINELITIVEIFIGIILCIKSDGINLLIKRMRTAGISAPPSN
ncbi:hypothetical protein [Pseudomonas sp. EA_35y_Pfl2_R111]|uniref:hypothetical protein n=1 Tax=Pseudomonas sp. EA_35y_Pfl2_R111 TaxID=3088689 RepID=UPI0030DD75CF